MKRRILFILLLLPSIAFSQVVKPGEIFSDVYTIDGKVVFLKEIRLNSSRTDTNYTYLCNWMKTNYGNSPLLSSLDFKKKDYAAHAVSRVELLLPENARGQRAKIIMKYTLDAFIVKDICVLEVTHITFLNNRTENGNTLPDKIKAEDMIANVALSQPDGNGEVRQNVKKSVLYFLNELCLDLEKALTE
ncbi:MAG: hypothetical protein LBR34_02885 [Prevotella sp.]|jgi:hypothetical protein|nr:hypothetical protein [Prevotella sp.]